MIYIKKLFVLILLSLILVNAVNINVFAGLPDYNIKYPSTYDPRPRFDQTKYIREYIFRGTYDNEQTFKTYYLVASGQSYLQSAGGDYYRPNDLSTFILYELIQVFENGQFKSQYWNNVSTQSFNGQNIINLVKFRLADIKWSNFNIEDWYTRAILYNTSQNPADDGYFIKFTLPGRDGFTDNTSRFAFWTYYKIPLSAEEKTEDIQIQVTGGQSSGSELLLNKTIRGNGYVEGYFNFSRVMNLGENSIKVTVTAPNGSKVEATRKVIYKEFEDLNGDGLDDTTGQPKMPELKPITDNTPDGTILGYFKWAFENITYIFTGLATTVSSLFQATGNISKVMADYMSFLPVEIRNFLILSVMVVVILKILKR